MSFVSHLCSRRAIVRTSTQPTTTHPHIALAIPTPLIPPHRDHPEQPRNILIHDERDARPRQDAHEVRPEPAVEARHALARERPADAGADVRVYV